jgi:hypothetical protein
VDREPIKLVLTLALGVDDTLGIPVSEMLLWAESGPRLLFGDADVDGEEDLNFDEKLLKSDLVLPPDPGLGADGWSVSQEEDTEDAEAAEEVLPRLLGREDSGFNVPKSDVEDDRIRPNLLLGAAAGVDGFSLVSLASFGDFSWILGSGREFFISTFSLSGRFFCFSSLSPGFSFIGSFGATLALARSFNSDPETTLPRRSFSMFALFIFLVSFFDFPRNSQSTSPLVTPES